MKMLFNILKPKAQAISDDLFEIAADMSAKLEKLSAKKAELQEEALELGRAFNANKDTFKKLVKLSANKESGVTSSEVKNAKEKFQEASKKYTEIKKRIADINEAIELLRDDVSNLDIGDIGTAA
jgi:chromosome segregation ATPase